MENKDSKKQDSPNGLKFTEDKASLGGAFNSGVTSSSNKVRSQIEKKASLLPVQPSSHNDESFGNHLMSPRQHGLLDYALTGSLLVLPALFGLSKKVRKIYAAEAVTLLAYVALTDHPTALKPVIPFETHGKVDRMNVASFAMQTMSKPFRKDRKAAAFNIAFTAISALTLFFTDWKGIKK